MAEIIILVSVTWTCLFERLLSSIKKKESTVQLINSGGIVVFDFKHLFFDLKVMLLKLFVMPEPFAVRFVTLSH